MKKYIKPTIVIQKVVMEQLLLAGSEGGQIGHGDAKGNDDFDEDAMSSDLSINDVWN